MKYFLLFILVLFSLISFSFAERGCCSRHKGVCGNTCCDGSPLSAVCGGGSSNTTNNINWDNYTRLNSPNRKVCPTNSFRNTYGICECIDGYEPDFLGIECTIDKDKVCDQEKPGTIYNDYSKTCVCKNGERDAKEQKCIPQIILNERKKEAQNKKTENTILIIVGIIIITRAIVRIGDNKEIFKIKK